LMVVFQSFSPKSAGADALTYDQFVQEVQGNRVGKVNIAEDRTTISGERKDGTKFTTYNPGDKDLVNDLINHDVTTVQTPPSSGLSLGVILINVLPWLLFIGIWVYFMRQMQQGGGKGAMSFGRSRAKLLNEDQTKVTFGDVAGCDEAKEEVSELVEFLRDPGRFQKLGGKIPRGVLMVGPPGTGKTLLAKAIAGEAKVPFFSISGSDFVEMFVGVGASRVRDMFEQAKKQAPCIIFIDEIDAVMAAIAAPAWVAAMTNASRRSISCSSRWTGSKVAKASSWSPRPTVPTCSIRRCCARDVSTARSWSACPTCVAANRSSRSTCARCRWPTTSCRWSSRAARPASPAPILRTSSTRPHCSLRARTAKTCAWSISTRPATKS
jgi:hypothetical protein